MKIVNRHGLPQAIVNAVQNDPYDNKGSLSVTRLLSPAYQRKLMGEHWNDLEEDVSDRVWALFGQSVHHIIERAAGSGDIVEQRLFADIESAPDKFKVSGQLDHLSKLGILSDWKVTSVWGVKDALKNGKPEWEAQLNMLKWLCEHGHMKQQLPKVKRLQVVALSRDWNKSGSLRDNDYPAKIEVIEFPIWSEEKVKDFLGDRILEHTTDNPPPCSDEERWMRAGKVAVMKKGRKTALRLLDTMEEAADYCNQKGYPLNGTYYAEERPAKYPRCEDYCSVNMYCPVWQDYLLKKSEEIE